MLKMLIKKCLHAVGYEIYRPGAESTRVPVPANIELYRTLFPAESLEHRRFYNIGAGAFRHPVWTTVDHVSDWCFYKDNRPDIDWDIMEMTPIPVEGDMAELVYSSHTIEHIHDEAALHLFREAYRILKPGGYFRITTPDIDLYYRAYRENDRRFFFWIDDPAYSDAATIRQLGLRIPLRDVTIGQLFLYEFASSAASVHEADTSKISDSELERIFHEQPYEEALNYCTSKCRTDVQQKYPGNHINWWNAAKCERLLRSVGFTRVYRSGYGQSFSPALRETRYFDNTFPQISLYMEAIKEKTGPSAPVQ